MYGTFPQLSGIPTDNELLNWAKKAGYPAKKSDYIGCCFQQNNGEDINNEDDTDEDATVVSDGDDSSEDEYELQENEENWDL